MGEVIDFREYLKKRAQKKKFVIPLHNNFITSGELWALVGRNAQLEPLLKKLLLTIKRQNLFCLHYSSDNLSQQNLTPNFKESKIKPKQILKELLKVKEPGVVIIGSASILEPDFENPAGIYDSNSWEKIFTALENIMKISSWSGIILFRKDICRKDAEICPYLTEFSIRKRFSRIWHLGEEVRLQKS